MAKVELRNVTKAWDKATAVKDMSLVIEDGEFVSLLGPSGCGKSTTLLMLAGIYLPTKGDILFDGAIINEVEARERNVSIVFQSYALYPNMTALQNIMFPLRFQPNSRGEALAREMADLVQVGELLERKPSELSGGQQQRVALARALVKSPNLLLLDEPLSNLDASLRLTMRAEIKRITRKFNLTTVLVTEFEVLKQCPTHLQSLLHIFFDMLSCFSYATCFTSLFRLWQIQQCFPHRPFSSHTFVG